MATKVEKLAEMIVNIDDQYKRAYNEDSEHHYLEVLASALSAAIRGEQRQWESSQVNLAERVGELMQKVKAMEKQIADLSALHDCIGLPSDHKHGSEASEPSTIVEPPMTHNTG